MTFDELVGIYIDKFSSSPPIFGFSEEEAMAELTVAISSGVAITDPWNFLKQTVGEEVIL